MQCQADDSTAKSACQRDNSSCVRSSGVKTQQRCGQQAGAARSGVPAVHQVIAMASLLAIFHNFMSGAALALALTGVML